MFPMVRAERCLCARWVPPLGQLLCGAGPHHGPKREGAHPTQMHGPAEVVESLGWADSEGF